MDDEHRVLQLRAYLFQIDPHFVTVSGVVHHDEQHGLFAELLMLSVALAPFLDAQLQVVGILLGDERALVFGELGAAGRIR